MLKLEACLGRRLKTHGQGQPSGLGRHCPGTRPGALAFGSHGGGLLQEAIQAEEDLGVKGWDPVREQAIGDGTYAAPTPGGLRPLPLPLPPQGTLNVDWELQGNNQDHLALGIIAVAIARDIEKGGSRSDERRLRAIHCRTRRDCTERHMQVLHVHCTPCRRPLHVNQKKFASSRWRASGAMHTVASECTCEWAH